MSDSTKGKKDDVVRAEFTDPLPSGLGNNSTSIFLRGVHQTTSTASLEEKTQDNESEHIVIPSPMMESTPSGISSAMVKLYPYLIVANYCLGVLTWSNKNIWSSVLVVAGYIILVSQLSFITKYLGHIIIVAMLLGYTKLNQFIEKTIYDHATIEDIVEVMNQVSFKFDLLFLPLTNLDVENIEKLLWTMVLMSPLVIIINLLILPPKRCLIILGAFLLTYHSPAAKVTRRLLWKFKTVRKIIYYTTGLNLGGIDIENNKGYDNLLANVQKQVNKKLLISTGFTHDGDNSTVHEYSPLTTSDSVADENKPIKFTYVLYENQRHWIGMGWKSSMLNYERTSWTDEFLNEAPSPDKFQLPPTDNVSGMKWRWLDKTWRLDLTNDGAIDVGKNKLKTTADPTPDQGYIYYDNSWKKPSTEESFSKYTRRRRWIRTAELVKIDSTEGEIVESKEEDKSATSSKKTSKRNSRIISNSNAYDSFEMKINDDSTSNHSNNDTNDFMAHDSTNLSQLKRIG